MPPRKYRKKKGGSAGSTMAKVALATTSFLGVAGFGGMMYLNRKNKR